MAQPDYAEIDARGPPRRVVPFRPREIAAIFIADSIRGSRRHRRDTAYFDSGLEVPGIEFEGARPTFTPS
ncbi:hypothetical protein AS156_03330 [Bradyrhizobium macuxiense]|uniref:Uncharacterized protein n=1 Tax=Bradyrhizobium macuxiense TaxID=1755647 RepID=A0A125Q9Y0_9BRAD|nr:hypothetical protein AS156_03330 [Bradyrhizobium macuxiense]